MTEPLDALASDYAIPQPDRQPKPLGPTWIGKCDLGCGHDATWQMFELPRATVADPLRHMWQAVCPRCDGDCNCADCNDWTFKAQLRRRFVA